MRGDGSGERVVTAGDVAWPSEVESSTRIRRSRRSTAPDAVLDMDLWVTRDRGYRPAEAQETYSLGEIPIDAIFTPIQKVNFVVEHTRVGQMTDFDRLILEILTDGTIEPDERSRRRRRSWWITPGSSPTSIARTRNGVAAGSPFISDEVQNKPLADLGLSPRVLNALRSRQIEKVGQVLTMDPDQLLSIRNFGPRSLNELREKLDRIRLPAGRRCGVFGGRRRLLSTHSNRRWTAMRTDR